MTVVHTYFYTVTKTLLYAFFWVRPRHLEFICQRFGTLCLFRLHRRVDVSKMTGVESVGVFIGEKVWLENSLSQLEGG